MILGDNLQLSTNTKFYKYELQLHQYLIVNLDQQFCAETDRRRKAHHVSGLELTTFGDELLCSHHTCYERPHYHGAAALIPRG